MTPASLHVIAAPDPRRSGTPAGELLAFRLAAEAGPRDRTLIFGTSADREAAARLGVPRPWLASRPPGPAATHAAAATIRRAARALAAEGSIKAVVLWSRDLDDAARRLDPRTPIIRPPLDRDEDDQDDWLASATAGLPDRRRAREAIGLDDAPAIAPLAASPAHVDARALAFVSGVLDLLGHRHSLLLPDRAQRLQEALRFIHQTSLRTRVVLVQPPMLAALPAADVLIRPAETDHGSGVPKALCELARLQRIPVVSTAGWHTDARLEPGNLPPEINATVGPAVRAIEIILAAQPA